MKPRTPLDLAHALINRLGKRDLNPRLDADGNFVVTGTLSVLSPKEAAWVAEHPDELRAACVSLGLYTPGTLHVIYGITEMPF